MFPDLSRPCHIFKLEQYPDINYERLILSPSKEKIAVSLSAMLQKAVNAAVVIALLRRWDSPDL